MKYKGWQIKPLFLVQILLFRYEIKTTLFILSSKLLLESTILYSILQPEWSKTGKHKVTTSSVTNSSDEIIFVKRNKIKIGIKIPNSRPFIQRNQRTICYTV